MPFYGYETIIPTYYYRADALVPESFIDSTLKVRFSGCFYEVSVNDNIVYSNTSCRKETHEEKEISLKGFVKPGLNKVKFHFLADGTTIRFEVDDARQNNLIRYVILVILVALFVYLVTRRLDYVFSVLCLSVLILHLFPQRFYYTWGFEALSRYPLSVKIIVSVVSILICIPPIYKLFDYSSSILYRVFRKITSWSNPELDNLKKSHTTIYSEIIILWRYLTYFLMGLISLIIFWFFKTKRSMGDAGFVGQLALNNQYTFMSTGPLSSWFVTFSHNVIKSIGVPYSSYEIAAGLSCFYGAIAIPLLWVLCKELTNDRWRSFAIFSIVSTSYFIILFFGDIEFYSALTLGILLYIYSSVLYLKDKIGSIFFPSFFYAVTFCISLSFLTVGPSLFLLFFLKMLKKRGRGFSKEFFTMILSASIPIVLFIGHVIFVYHTGLYGSGGCSEFKQCIEYYKNRLSDGALIQPGLFTLHHIEEMLNEHILISSASLILFVFLLINIKRINLKDSKLIFIGSVTLLFGTYVWLHHSTLGLPQDWNTYGALGLPVTLLVSYALVNNVKDNKELKFYVVTVIIVTLLVHTLPSMIYDIGLMDLFKKW
jgi:hypothetical protein